ncbi:hypothetical protein [Mycobacterium sp. 236(2023)]|uniref:hypothetical protein n=1 Tax=Mycobacterium sp. 236(2023) TaxID=3038163 RepID=UPI002414F317|nr:hypothetical protein [Mycobacterium sp. 236(2023)]MDG4667968.1 hypothetical protein [Mycobacterium sp. 236(2023)]
MPYEQGVSDWRVYSAEQSVGHDRPVSADECQELVEQAAASDWFQEWFPHTPAIEVKVEGGEHPDLGLISSYATHWGYPLPTKWLISVHPKMMTARVLLHELAHCVQPIYEAAEGLRTDRDQSYHWNRRKHRSHGEYFTAALGVITDNMLPDDDGQLFSACRHYEAPIASVEALREQVLAQPEILDDEQRWFNEIQRQSAEIEARYEAEHGGERRMVIPQTPWGFNIEWYRRDVRRRMGGRLVSQKRVAEAVAKVTPCSARHISALENSRERPEDPAQLKRAMLVAIFLGLDPIWTRYNLGLTRWDCGGITMRQARTMNWRWARLVAHLNKLQREMPPRWYVEGGR